MILRMSKWGKSTIKSRLLLGKGRMEIDTSKEDSKCIGRWNY